MKLMKFIILIYIFLLFSFVTAELTLTDRIDEVKYTVVVVHGEEAKEKTFEGIPISMTSPVTKEKLTCFIPPERSTEFWEEADEDIERDVRKILEPLASACLYRLTGWWRYEFCFNRHVRQYHQEGDKPVRAQDEFYLGRFQDQAGEEYPEYYKETYGDGTICDITGKPRSVEIHYYCAQGLNSLISDLKETSSCNYVMSVSTPLLCHHASYKPKKEHIEKVYCVSNDEKSQLVTHLASEEEKISQRTKERQGSGANGMTPFSFQVEDGVIQVEGFDVESYSDDGEDFVVIRLNSDNLGHIEQDESIHNEKHSEQQQQVDQFVQVEPEPQQKKQPQPQQQQQQPQTVQERKNKRVSEFLNKVKNEGSSSKNAKIKEQQQQQSDQLEAKLRDQKNRDTLQKENEKKKRGKQ